MPQPVKPSLRNIISSAQEYLTFVEGCPEFEKMAGVQQNAVQLRQQIEDYNVGVRAGKGEFGPNQLKFEDEHAKKIAQTLVGSRQLAQKASTDPKVKDYVVDGGGSEWNRVNPLKLANHLRDLGTAELGGIGRSPSAYHNPGSMEYEAHGNGGVLRIRNANQTLSPVATTAASTTFTSKPPQMGR